MGFIAEEVGEHIPEIVTYEKDGVYASGIDYGAITPLLDELSSKIEEMKKML